MSDNPYRHEICPDCADAHNLCGHTPVSPCPACAYEAGARSRDENAKVIMENIPASCRVRVREGNGPEDIQASLAVSIAKLVDSVGSRDEEVAKQAEEIDALKAKLCILAAEVDADRAEKSELQRRLGVEGRLRLDCGQHDGCESIQNRDDVKVGGDL